MKNLFVIAACITLCFCQPPPPNSRLGSCPAVDHSTAGLCAEFCSSDSDCIQEGQRCCSNGCGHACMNTVIPDSHPADIDCPHRCEQISCLFGQFMDANGCPICDCGPAPPPTGVHCPPVCFMYCEYGNVLDHNGCPLCECLPPPANIDCPPVCDVWCEHGHVPDEDGCKTCTCNPGPTTCGPYLSCYTDEECVIQQIDTCQMDSNCVTQQKPHCIKKLDKQDCDHNTTCDIQCDNGLQVVDKEGCMICTCSDLQLPASLPVSCPDLDCDITCPVYGLKRNPDGCLLCECSNQPPECDFMQCSENGHCVRVYRKPDCKDGDDDCSHKVIPDVACVPYYGACDMDWINDCDFQPCPSGTNMVDQNGCEFCQCKPESHEECRLICVTQCTSGIMYDTPGCAPCHCDNIPQDLCQTIDGRSGCNRSEVCRMQQSNICNIDATFLAALGLTDVCLTESQPTCLPKYVDCGDVDMSKCNLDCSAAGYIYNTSGCPMCKCASQPSDNIMCPEVICPVNCPYDHHMTTDIFGCVICECTPTLPAPFPSPDCPDPRCSPSCQYNDYIDDGIGCGKRCVCRDHPDCKTMVCGINEHCGTVFTQPQCNCPPYSLPSYCSCPRPESHAACLPQHHIHCDVFALLMCSLHCEYGYMKDEQGCEFCGCQPPPTSTHKCPPVCETWCENSMKQDIMGCNICECNTVPASCEQMHCEPDQVCQLTDSTVCPSCISGPCTCTTFVEPACIPRYPTSICPSRGCDYECEYGNVYDFSGCPTCRCKPPNKPDCEEFICDKTCPYGYKKSAHHCDMCECEHPCTSLQCDEDEECDIGASELCYVLPEMLQDPNSLAELMGFPKGMPITHPDVNDNYPCSWVAERICVPTHIQDPDKCPSLESCALKCPNGYIKSREGCDMCRCNPFSWNSDMTCPDIDCQLSCEYGLMEDASGCSACTCRPPIFPIGVCGSDVGPLKEGEDHMTCPGNTMCPVGSYCFKYDDQFRSFSVCCPTSSSDELKLLGLNLSNIIGIITFEYDFELIRHSVNTFKNSMLRKFKLYGINTDNIKSLSVREGSIIVEMNVEIHDDNDDTLQVMKTLNQDIYGGQFTVTHNNIPLQASKMHMEYAYSKGPEEKEGSSHTTLIIIIVLTVAVISLLTVLLIVCMIKKNGSHQTSRSESGTRGQSYIRPNTPITPAVAYTKPGDGKQDQSEYRMPAPPSYNEVNQNADNFTASPIGYNNQLYEHT